MNSQACFVGPPRAPKLKAVRTEQIIIGNGHGVHCTYIVKHFAMFQFGAELFAILIGVEVRTGIL